MIDGRDAKIHLNTRLGLVLDEMTRSDELTYMTNILLNASSTGIFSITSGSSNTMNKDNYVGNIQIKVNNRLEIFGGGGISSATQTVRHAGFISVEAGTLLIDGGNSLSRSISVNSMEIALSSNNFSHFSHTGISSTAIHNSQGHAGDISVRVSGQLEIYGGGFIDSSTYGAGDAGLVSVQAGSLLIDDMGARARLNRAVSNLVDKMPASTDPEQLNRMTEIVLNSAGTGIFSDTKLLNGRAGDIEVKVTNELSLHNFGKISSSTYTSGHAGAVLVRAREIQLTNQAKIASLSTRNAVGAPGELDIYASDNIILDNAAIDISTYAGDLRGDAGSSVEGDLFRASINIQTANLILKNGAQITTQADSDVGAGDIWIKTAKTIQLYDGSRITTSANLGDGGEITVETADYLYMNSSQIKTSVSTTTGDARGGDIWIDPIFVVLNDSQILAETFDGEGGNITIITDYFMQSGKSTISAAAKGSLGVSGAIDLQGPNVQNAAGVDKLPVNLLNAEQWVAQACSKKAGKLSSFLVKQILPTGYHNLLESALPYQVSSGDYTMTDMHQTSLSQAHTPFKPLTCYV